MVMQLLGSKKGTPTVLEFLATTHVGVRLTVHDQGQEKCRRGRNKALELDEERLEDSEEEEEENRGTGSKGSKEERREARVG